MDYWLILTKKSLLRRYPHISTSSDIGYESVPSQIILLLSRPSEEAPRQANKSGSPAAEQSTQ